MSTVVNPDSRVDPADLLDAVPVPNEAVEVEHEDDREVVLAVPLRRRWYMGPPVSWILPFSRKRRVGLDAFGREVWGLCDGRQSMERIVELFATNHRLSFHEARISVLSFLRELTRRGFLVVAGMPSAKDVA